MIWNFLGKTRECFLCAACIEGLNTGCERVCRYMQKHLRRNPIKDSLAWSLMGQQIRLNKYKSDKINQSIRGRRKFRINSIVKSPKVWDGGNMWHNKFWAELVPKNQPIVSQQHAHGVQFSYRSRQTAGYRHWHLRDMSCASEVREESEKKMGYGSIGSQQVPLLSAKNKNLVLQCAQALGHDQLKKTRWHWLQRLNCLLSLYALCSCHMMIGSAGDGVPNKVAIERSLIR